MKIAIPLFQNRVSPRFDFAPTLMVATVENNQIVAKEEISLKNYTLSQRSALLRELGIKTLICGAIQGFLTRSLENENVKVIAPVAGEVSNVLGCFLEGKLYPPCSQLRSAQGRGRCCSNQRRIRNQKKEKNNIMF
jgi:predicted Fe-Mo cluster-binding NifX family protein